MLPALAKRVAVAIPTPCFVGGPSPRFPAPYWGHQFIPGVTANRAEAVHWIALAAELGAFLRDLHSINNDVASSFGMPVDIGRGDVAYNQRRALELLRGDGFVPAAIDRSELRARLEEPVASESARVVPIHGDLHAGHLALMGDGRLSGVLDWGGVCIGDAALDLSIVFTSIPGVARAAFWSNYGDVDSHTRLRARHLGYCRYGVRAMCYAHAVGDAAALAFAINTLSAVWIDDDVQGA